MTKCRLILVRPMRAQFVICLLLVSSVASLARDANAVAQAYAVQAADVARRALSAAKFPPIPKKVAQAYGTDSVDIQADFDANADGSR